MTYQCMIALGNKTVAHTFLLSFDNVNGCLCQEKWLRSINIDTMVTWRHTSVLYIRYIRKSQYNDRKWRWWKGLKGKTKQTRNETK